MVPSDHAALAQLRKGALEHCVLALLRDGERYAFDIVKELSEVDGLLTSEGTIYPLLTRMRDKGLVDSVWRDSPSGPPRRCYTLTASGEQALSSFTDAWSVFKEAVDQTLGLPKP